MATDLEAISRALEAAANQQQSAHFNQFNGGNNSKHWLASPSPYTWETSFGPHEGVLHPKTQQPVYGDPVFHVRWGLNQSKLPGGVRLNTTHTLFNAPSDPSPRKFYCKECFHARDERGDLPPDGRCCSCEYFGPEAITPVIRDAISGMPPMFHGGYSGAEITKMLDALAPSRKMLIPLIVRGVYGPPVTEGFQQSRIFPSDDPNDLIGVIVQTNYMSKLYKGLLECKKEDPNLGDPATGRWMKLTRTKAGKGATTSLTNTINAEPLSPLGYEILNDHPDVATWGKNPPSQQSKRTTLNVSYTEMDHLIKSTTWYPTLVKMCEPFGLEW